MTQIKITRLAGFIYIMAGIWFGAVFGDATMIEVEEAARGSAPIQCGVNLELLGISPVQRVPRSEVGDETQSLNLRVRFLRFPTKGQPELLSSTKGLTEMHDIMLIYHVPLELVADELDAAREALSRIYGSPVAEAECEFDTGNDLVLYAPFLEIGTDGKSTLAHRIVVAARIVRITELRSTAVPFDIGAETELPLITWSRNSYPWIADLDFRPATVEEQVLAVDRLACESRGNFVVGSQGRVVSLPSTANESVMVAREHMLAANIYFGASGDPTNAEKVAASVDSEQYWCIPKREFCYQIVPFGDFGIPAKQGDVASFPASDVVSLRHGLIPALQSLMMSRCAIERMELP